MMRNIDIFRVYLRAVKSESPESAKVLLERQLLDVGADELLPVQVILVSMLGFMYRRSVKVGFSDTASQTTMDACWGLAEHVRKCLGLKVQAWNMGLPPKYPRQNATTLRVGAPG